MIRIVVVDDHPSVRSALRLRLALERDFMVVGEAQNGVEALDVVAESQPDVVLMDVEMPHMDGLAATRALATLAPLCAVVVISGHDDAATRSEARAAGAAAFLGKHELVGTRLPATIRAAAIWGVV